MATSSAALTTGKPRVTPLADPFGEAISYTADGKAFLTVSDAGRFSEDEPLDILSYTPSTTTAVPLAPEEGGKPASSKSWTDGLSLDDITYMVGAVGLIGLLLVAAGIFGIVRARRRPPTADETDTSEPDGEPFGPRGGRAVDGFPADDDRRGGVYGGGAPAGGAVYGGGAGRGGPAPAGGAVYGGGPRPAPADGGYGAPRPDGGGAGVYGGGGRPPAGGGGRPPVGGGRPPAGGGSPHSGGGRPQGGGRPGSGVYGGDGGQPGRAEPPRRGAQEPDYRGQRPGRRRDDDPPIDPYGQYPGGGRGHRGDRY